ncbi:MAG: hypothetical protein ACI88H_000556 [Cocleimonas sp.]|jgi:hypothetical protein
MKIKHQLSIATLLMAGVFVTGCSQQSAGGSQVAGGSQSQVEGGSQVAGGSQSQVEGGSQVAGSQQQVEGAAPVVAEPVMAPAPKPVMAPKAVVAVNRWAHTHPAVPRCTDSVSHTHKYNQASHSHNYSCQGQAMAAKPQVDVRALQMKLQAKGYYKGPIDGIVGPGTRSALQRFMKR